MITKIILLVLLGALLALAWKQRAKLADLWNSLAAFVEEIRLEMKKVAWPAKDEVIGNTIVVLTMVVAVSLLIGIEDQILAKVIQGMFQIGK